MPTDRDEDPVLEGDQRAGDNTYRVTVRIGAGGEDGALGSDDYDGDDLDEIKLTVTVTNVNEPGMVLISPLQPQVGTDLTAILTDQDVMTGLGEWQWASADSMNGTFTDIPRLSKRQTYQPTADDLGKYLRVTVVYVDRAGDTPRTVQKVSDHTVREDVVTTTDPPMFPDQSTLGIIEVVDGDEVPARASTERFIRENSPAGTNVGAPVTAFDDATAIDLLTYSLRDTTPGDDHAGNFRINPRTGQITVAPGAMLNADVAASDLGGATMPYLVTVRAVDPDGDDMDIAVTIRLLDVNEGPRIDRTYVDRTTATLATPVISADDYTIGNRVPTEISHVEVDRRSSEHQSVRNTTREPSDTDDVALRNATVLDTDLDTAVDWGTDNLTGLQAAIYVATDPDVGATDDLKWTLEGPDNKLLSINEDVDSENLATLRFKNAPDFEDKKDANKDNVYEVTIVVTDETSGKKDELDVTVKVINSKEDNQPGKVSILNRHPEVATALAAELEDPDKPREPMWQWYRSEQAATNARTRCPEYNPFIVDRGPFRDFVIDADSNGEVTLTSPTNMTAWLVIPGATQATYTPGYDDRVGGNVTYQVDGSPLTPNAPPQPPAVHQEVWSGGDIGVTVTKAPLSGGGYEITGYVWADDSSKCLRATVTYRDGADDRTHLQRDEPDTKIDETQEGTFRGSEYPVKPRDEENDSPVFTHNGQPENAEPPNAGNSASIYRAEMPENATPAGTDPDTTTDDLLINEAFPATDPAIDEDDASDDILTYSLSGPDAEHFVIVGSIEHPESYDPDGDDDTDNAIDVAGSLFITAELNYDGNNPKRRYQVKITATDPSGDSNDVDVVVEITNVNEKPEWDMPEEGKRERYEENGTTPVLTFKASDPETSGITYSLATEGTIGDFVIGNADIADNARFEISSISGRLTFKASPNYEEPADIMVDASGDETPAEVDNMYRVAVQAKVADPVNTAADITTITRAVTVIVINENETPVFPRTTGTLEISENPDDREKEASGDSPEKYLLNRGVGKPAAHLPEAPDLDVGIPMLAVDDDSAGDFAIGGYAEGPPALRDRIDGLTYELSGDAAPFHIVPATGQILTLKKLDYESKKTYKVTVKATDPWGAYDTIGLTINVIDVDEAPVAGLLELTGESGLTHPEKNTADLGTYTSSGTTYSVTWTLEGDDAGRFMFKEEDGDVSKTRTLQLKSALDFEMPRGQAMSATNTNEYNVTIKASAGGEVEMVEVTVTVTNVDEPGTVTLTSMGGKVGTPLTAELSDDDIVVGAIEWQWYRVDPATGNSNPITGARNSSYTPVAADVGHHLMVTAIYTDEEGAGKSASERTTTAVADANAAPEFASATATFSVAENMPSRTLVGSPITATDPNGNNLSYSDSGTDSASFTVDNQGQLRTSASFNYEAKSSYSVTITATDPEGATGSIVVSVNVTNVDEDGMVSLSPNRPSIGTPITASVTDPDGTTTGVTYQWSHSTAMGGPFTLYPAENTASITPVEADFGRYLRVMVSYSDGLSAKILSVTTGTVTRSPAHSFPSATATRSVAENTAAGTNIGTPVAATDVNGDTLTYTLSGTDAASFDIGISTGQLMTKAALDYETKRSYMVTVTATHPDGATASTMVTIMVTDVDETTEPLPDTLIERYDTNPENDMIDRAEVISAINDYLDTGVPSRADVIRLINLYLDS